MCRPDAARTQCFAGEPAYPFRGVTRPASECVDAGIEVIGECRACGHPYPFADGEVLVICEVAELTEQHSGASRGASCEEKTCPSAHGIGGMSCEALNLCCAEAISQGRADACHAFQNAEFLCLGGYGAQFVVCVGEYR